MNESIISLLDQIHLFKQDEKTYQAPEAQKFFDRITYYTSIQEQLEEFEESKISK